MRIFNKMKKTMLVLAASLFCANVAFAEVKTGSYAVVASDVASGAQITSVEGITLTYGTAEDWISGSGKSTVGDQTFSVYATCSATNPSPKDGKVPTAGAYVVLNPQYAGTVTVAVSNAAVDKNVYVVKNEDNNLVNGSVVIDGTVTEWTSGTPCNIDAKYNGGVTFDVEAGATYYFYLSGSKMRFNGFIYTYDDAPAAPALDFTACNEAIAWANAEKAKLNADDETEAQVIEAIEMEIESLQETMADPEATQEDLDLFAGMFKESVQGYIDMIAAMKLMSEVEKIGEEGWALYDSYPEDIRTDEAGLAAALSGLPRSAMGVTAEQMQAAIDAVKAAMEAFKAENDANMAGGDAETVELTKDMYKVWDGVGADAQPTTDAAYCEVNFGEGKTFDQGATLYGNGNVSYNQYADLTGYEKIVFEGTPGLTVRLMFNRQLPLEEGAEGYDKNGGAYVEKLPVLDAEGKGEYDLTELDFAHLNAIKIPWNGTTGASVTKISLVKAAEGAGSTTIDLIAPTEGVNILEAGKTYVLGKQYEMYKVQFTAEKDGFLSITPSQKISSTSLKINGASSTFTKDANGGISKKGMAAGSVFEGTFYCSGTPSAENVYELVVTFEEGTPYSPLALTLASPADGAEWSGAVEYKSYGTKGVPHYEFSSIISADVKASVKIGDKVYENIKLTVDGYNPKLDITALPDTLSKAIAAGLIKAGETFTLTLSNIIDKDFAANTLADQTFTYTLASTACTGVASDASTSNLPTYVTFSFDGTVNIDNAKFYYVNMFTEETVELTAEIVEGTSVKIAAPVIEGLPSRQYKIVAENVTDADGKAISYTNDAITYPLEEGKLIFTKALNNSVFNNGKTASISTDKWGVGYTQMYSLKSFAITFPGPVVLDETVTTPVTFTKDEEETGGGDIDWWAEGDDAAGEGSESTDTEITVSHAISATDPCTVIFTLSQEVTELGKYSFEIPSKLYWAKDYYSTNADTLNNFGYYLPSTYAYAEVIPVPVADGTYYMKNVAAGKFMTGGNSWGTRASLGEHGLDVKFTFTANGKYTLDTNVPSGSVAKHYLGSNGFIDSDLAEWVIEKQANGTFLISLDKTNYLGYSEGSTEVNLALPATAGEAIQWQLITKEELVAGLAEASEENPVDATFFIVGQNFNRADDTRNAAWQGAPAFGGGNNTNWCAEKWNLDFDVYQDLTGLPNGYYILTAQGFYRAGGGGATAADQNAFLYANDVTTPLVNILAEAGNEAITGNVSTPEGYGNVPNNMESAGIAFAAGLYADHSISVKVTDGTLRIGVKKETLIANDWTIFDNFELTYLGAKNSLDLQVDTLKALVAEANELKASLDATDETHAQIIGMIDQMVPAAQAVIDAPASVAAVKEMSSSVYMFLFQTKIQLAQYEAQKAQALMATYEEPTDEAGFAAAINQVFIVSNGLMMNEGTYTLEQLDEAVAAMKAAQEAFIKENTKITEVSVSLTHTASSYCEGDANAYKSTVDTAKEYVNNSAFNGTWQGAAYAEFSVLLPEGVSIKSATLTWTGIGESRNARNTDVYYVNAGNALDYEALQGGAAKVNLEATKITSVTFPKGKSEVFTTDVTSAVEAIVAAGQNYIIFKFTGNPGGGHLAGKADAANAPVLTLETADASAMTTYTVKYVDGAGTELKTADVYSILIGETATIADENKAAIYNEDKSAKYIYVSCDKESLVTVADSASNVITATFREAAKYNYTVETTDDSGSLAITMGSYSGFEGENVVAPYYAYVLNEADSTLYESAKNGKEYNKYVDLTQDNMKVQVAYTPTTIKNIVYYQEAENVEGLTKITTGNTAIRSSNSASAYAADADVVLTTLAPGKYKLAAVIYDATKALNSEFSFIAGSDTILKAVSTAANWTNCVSEEFTLTANTTLSLAKGGSSSKGVDLFYIQKTGDVELPAKVAYLCGATETTEAIYTALTESGYDVTPLNYDEVTLTEEVVANDFVGKYDVVVLAGATKSGSSLAATHNLLIGKVNVLSTKAFWYNKTTPAGTNGTNPGTADAPSTGLVKVAGYEEHPIYAGIEGAEFAVFNESEAITNGRYFQGNGALSGIEQATIGTTLGANCIGEAWVDGKGWMIIPVDGDNSANFSLTADGAQLFVNAVDYLIAGEEFEFSAIEGVQVEGTQWPADIYDLSGRMIKKAATSLEGLEKGLYIVNGKKLLVK